MPRPTKRKATHKQVSRDKRGKFIKEDELNLMDTESIIKHIRINRDRIE